MISSQEFQSKFIELIDSPFKCFSINVPINNSSATIKKRSKFFGEDCVLCWHQSDNQHWRKVVDDNKAGWIYESKNAGVTTNDGAKCVDGWRWLLLCLGEELARQEEFFCISTEDISRSRHSSEAHRYTLFIYICMYNVHTYIYKYLLHIFRGHL